MEGYDQAEAPARTRYEGDEVAERRLPQVEEQTVLLDNNIDRYADLLDRLETSLRNVLTPTFPAAAAPDHVEEEIAPLANLLRTNNGRLGRLNDQLMVLLNRIEV